MLSTEFSRTCNEVSPSKRLVIARSVLNAGLVTGMLSLVVYLFHKGTPMSLLRRCALLPFLISAATKRGLPADMHLDPFTSTSSPVSIFMPDLPMNHSGQS